MKAEKELLDALTTAQFRLSRILDEGPDASISHDLNVIQAVVDKYNKTEGDTALIHSQGPRVYSVEELFDIDKADQHEEMVIKLSDLTHDQKRLLGITEVVTEVIIQVRGGNVTHVCSNNPNVTTKVLDYDNVGDDDEFDPDFNRADKLAKEATPRPEPGKYTTCW